MTFEYFFKIKIVRYLIYFSNSVMHLIIFPTMFLYLGAILKTIFCRNETAVFALFCFHKNVVRVIFLLKQLCDTLCLLNHESINFNHIRLHLL
jgi:hypothetical protein